MTAGVQGRLALGFKPDACVGSACLQRAPVSQHKPGASATNGLHSVRCGESDFCMVHLPTSAAHREDVVSGYIYFSAVSLTAGLSLAFRRGLRRTRF